MHLVVTKTYRYEMRFLGLTGANDGVRKVYNMTSDKRNAFDAMEDFFQGTQYKIIAPDRASATSAGCVLWHNNGDRYLLWMRSVG